MYSVVATTTAVSVVCFLCSQSVN